jgi:hypothetical protein
MRSRLLHLALLALFAVTGPSSFAAEELQRTGGPYVPTPQVVVDSMLQFAHVGDSDYVIDLGSGDGVIVLTAASRYRASGMGVDIDPELVQLSNNKAKSMGIAERADFVVQDIFQTDLSRASVLTLYLLPQMMLDLRAKIFNELKPGTRIVAHDYHFGEEWLSDDEISFDVPEKEMVNGVPKATIRLWIVPAKVAGDWAIRLPPGSGPESYELALRQQYKTVMGSVAAPGGKPARLGQAVLKGDDFSFTVPAEGKGGALRFSGKVKGDAMEGLAELPGKGVVRFTGARRSAAAPSGS